ncbi:hypothetical protein AB0H73_27365 [Streptomyces olivoreticuli]
MRSNRLLADVVPDTVYGPDAGEVVRAGLAADGTPRKGGAENIG